MCGVAGVGNTDTETPYGRAGVTTNFAILERERSNFHTRCLDVTVLGVPLTAGVAVFTAERDAREAAAAFTDDDVAPGVRMPLTSRGALFPAKRVG